MNGLFLRDLGERVGTTFLQALIPVVTLVASGAADIDWRAQLLLVGGPTALSLIKGLLAKLGGDPDSASLTVGVVSKETGR